MAERFEEGGNELEAVSIALKNIIASGGDLAANNKKLAALSTLIDDLTIAYNDFVRWLYEKQDIMITLTTSWSSIKVPLGDLFVKYTDPIRANAAIAYAVIKQLNDQRLKVPTIDQVTKLVTSSDGIITALKGCVDFVATHGCTYPVIKTFPVTQAAVTKLISDLDTVKQMPY